MDRTVFLIPCYNEALTIEKVIKDCFLAIPDAKVYVYDNNSTDDTALIAEKAGAIVRHEYKQGKGNVIRSMFRQIDAECYIMVDGDDTYSLEQSKTMSELVLNKSMDMVIGDRLSSTYFTENKRHFHNFGNNLVRNAINYFFKSDIKDVMTGLRAFSYQFVKTFPVLSNGFEIETEMTIHAIDKKMAVQNVVIEYRDRPAGSVSKLNTYTDGIRVLATIVKLYKNYKPLQFFSLISVFLVVVASLFFVPLVITFISTGLVPKIPTLVFCCFTYIAALLSFFTGLILSTIVQKDRRDFEHTLQNTTFFYNLFNK